MADSPETVPPVVCSLTTKALATRTLEWTDLRGLALSRERLADGARSTFDLADAEAIDRLAAQEIDCCGTWLDITTTRSDVLTLELTTENPEGLDLIRTMVGIEGS